MQLITHTHSSTTAASRRARRLAQRTTLAACAIVALTAPGVAPAADTIVAPDPAADQVAALDGTVVWVSGADYDQVLMQRTGGVIKRVEGAPRAGYISIDLGRDRKGKLVLIYTRCRKSNEPGGTCTAKRDDLHGKRASFKNLTLKRCSLSTAPAVWGTRLAYGLSCGTPNNVSDEKRSGLYVKTGAGSPRRLRPPKKFGASQIKAVDLRGDRVAAITSDLGEYAFTRRVDGSGLRSHLVGLAEGDSQSTSMGVSLGTNNAMWTLSTSETSDEPNRANIYKISSSCYRFASLVNPPGPNQQQGFPATDLAVDRTTLYLVVPGTGIVKHRFAPQGGCTKL